LLLEMAAYFLFNCMERNKKFVTAQFFFLLAVMLLSVFGGDSLETVSGNNDFSRHIQSIFLRVIVDTMDL
jgi:hypothetical protein